MVDGNILYCIWIWGKKQLEWELVRLRVLPSPKSTITVSKMGFRGINVDQPMSSSLQMEMIGNIRFPYLQCFIICMEHLSPVFNLPAFVSYSFDTELSWKNVAHTNYFLCIFIRVRVQFYFKSVLYSSSSISGCLWPKNIFNLLKIHQKVDRY